MLAALIISGCTNPASLSSPPQGIEAGKGQIRLSLDSPQGARTLFPDDWNSLTFRVTFTAKGGIASEGTISRTFTTDHTETLRAGDWDVYVEALDGLNPVGDYLQQNVAVTWGATTEVKARIQPLAAALPNGTLNWKITYPSAMVDHAQVAYAIVAPSLPGIDILDTSDPTISTSSDGPKDTKSSNDSLAPGAYTFIVWLKNDTGGKTAGRAESVHIYSGLTTTVEMEFTESSFSYTTEYKVAVSMPHPTPEVTITSATLGTTAKIDGRDLFLPKTITGNSVNVIFTIEVDSQATALSGVYLEIITSANSPNKLTYDSFATVSPLTATMDLGMVYVAPLRAIAGTGGQVRINGSAAGTSLQRDILLYSTTTVTAVPGSGYRTDTFTVTASGFPIGFSRSGEDCIFNISSVSSLNLVNVTFAQTGNIHVTVTQKEDMAFTGLDAPITLSKFAGDTHTITLTSHPSAYWSVDGAHTGFAIEGNSSYLGNSFTLRAIDYRVGSHNLSIVKSTNNPMSSKQVTFTVIN
jgi:hypothetical protein